ncbi:uncharacterized protein N7469_005616 [Penicillium citrinum]|uniref:Uncharacterized protein n=1 Tax=Penicillium citrinum TaxID=5077 RepID=A0A9W9P2D6_PENCI|nr:uncharacterized protein N7469_005616 [Penicillium citrinum]KAJ5233850.1 hypothetical protein N7469_005616 [Penicillium citrinum]
MAASRGTTTAPRLYYETRWNGQGYFIESSGCNSETCQPNRKILEWSILADYRVLIAWSQAYDKYHAWKSYWPSNGTTK